ncbi:MAG: hypothetical protein EBT64_09935 [Gammaproteobacteria bacterium]|nr:hypothetical protein [Gammaproteobacteria bacterium]
MTRMTRDQEQQIMRLGSAAVEAALKGFTLEIDRAALVIANGDEFAQVVKDAAASAINRLSVPIAYAKEEVKSKYNYPPEYTGTYEDGYRDEDTDPVTPIGVQICDLARTLDISQNESLRFADQELPKFRLPDGAEGWFAIPKVEAIAARHFKNVTDPRERYRRSVLLLFDKLTRGRRLFGFSEERHLRENQVRQRARTVVMLERLGEVQKGDILIVPAQFGLRHSGRSVRRSEALLTSTEFGLGMLAVGAMTLTHSKRFKIEEQHSPYCAGDELSREGDEVFSYAPLFYSMGIGLFKCLHEPINRADPRFGAATGFLLSP